MVDEGTLPTWLGRRLVVSGYCFVRAARAALMMSSPVLA